MFRSDCHERVWTIVEPTHYIGVAIRCFFLDINSHPIINHVAYIYTIRSLYLLLTSAAPRGHHLKAINLLVYTHIHIVPRGKVNVLCGARDDLLFETKNVHTIASNM